MQLCPLKDIPVKLREYSTVWGGGVGELTHYGHLDGNTNFKLA